MEGTFSKDKEDWGPILNISKGGMLLQLGGEMKLLGKEIPIAVDGKVLRLQNGCVAIKFEKTIDLSAAIR